MIKANTKAHAAIVIIGNEILSGRTQDLNVSFLSKWLNDLGVRVIEVRIIEDSEESIIKCINEVRKKGNYKLADILRKELEDNNVIIEDKQNKTTWKYK